MDKGERGKEGAPAPRGAFARCSSPSSTCFLGPTRCAQGRMH